MLTTGPPLSCLIVLLLAIAPNAREQARTDSRPATQGLVEAVVYTSLRPPNLDIYLFDKPSGSPRRLTDDPALDYNAVFSPDGLWIVFTSERTGNADLYALNLREGGPPARLTRHEGMDDAASFSPDGQRLAFVSTRDGDADIFVMPFAPGDATSERRAVNLTRRPGGDFNPAFSPDGRRIAFSRQEQLLGSPRNSPVGRFSTEQYGIELYVMEADGSNVRRLSEPQPTLQAQARGMDLPLVSGSPAWSLDGNALYYYQIAKEGAAIRRITLDGSSGISIAPAGLSPAVTPDGRIAFVRVPRPNITPEQVPRSGHIVSVAANGSDLRVESQSDSSCFSPDFDRRSGRMVCHGLGPVVGLSILRYGAALAMAEARRRVALPDRTLEVQGIRGYFPMVTPAGDVLWTPLLPDDGRTMSLHTSAIDGTDVRELFTPPSGIAWGAAIAHDARVMVVAVGPAFAAPDAPVDIWRLGLDGSQPVNLTADSAANDALPHMSHDGRRIVFRSGRDGGMSVYLMDGDGNNLRRLGDGRSRDTMPALSPDGEWVVFTTDRVDVRKLWLQRVGGSDGRLLEPDRRDIPDISMHPRFSPDGKWVVFTSNRAGLNDEWPLTWHAQPYGELWAVPVAGGPAVRLTHDKWEDGPNDWGYVRLTSRRPGSSSGDIAQAARIR
jgi:TolB protein